MQHLLPAIICALLLLGCRSTETPSTSILEAADDAEDSLQYKRFSQWLEVLEGIVKEADGDEKKAAKNIVEGTARVATFNLQALGRLYAEIDPAFNDFRDDYKSLEDSIGTYDFWIERKNSNEKDKAFSDLKKLLKKRDWVKAEFHKSRIADHKKFLKKHDWMSYKKDKHAIIARLKDQVDSITSKNLDMSILENEVINGKSTYGVHELRREVRWFLIEARALNGLVRFKNDDQKCPVDEYKNLNTASAEDGKYSELPENEPKDKACKISKCLFLASNKIVGQLGKVKDTAEDDKDARRSNRVPNELKSQAEEILKKMRRTELTNELSKELKNCID